MLRPITTEEMTALQFATVRESCVRRNWPNEVVEALLAAEVIRAPEQSRIGTTTRDCATHQPVSFDRPAHFDVLMYD